MNRNKIIKTDKINIYRMQAELNGLDQNDKNVDLLTHDVMKAFGKDIICHFCT